MMKFKFDATQQFQIDGINAVVDLFRGQTLNQGSFELSVSESIGFMGASQALTHLGIGNNLELKNDEINQNLKKIQRQNNITRKTVIEEQGRNFAIEMETGTGKTYVYLRTIFELNEKFGFKKFIIVVPSVAIREGVLKSIDIMKEHFLNLYNNTPFNHFVYDSKRVNELRGFAAANEMQIMVINIDSFNKKENNIIHDIRDKLGGRKPIEFVQATNPIVIMDEPQNMESEKAKTAILSLKPLCTLRYSATHRDRYNLIYQLDPIDAFQMRLVKKISVAPVLAENNANAAFIKVNKIKNKNGRFSVGLTIHKQTPDGPKAAQVTVKQDDDLFIKSNEREMYRNGFIVTEINARPGTEYVKFSNGIRLRLEEEQGGFREDIIKEQIRETIKAHFEKEAQVKNMGIKVLSLFFIDKVANYRVYTNGGYNNGIYAEWFEEIYTHVAEEYRTQFNLEIIPADKVHNGYFSKDKKGKIGKFMDTSGKTAKDEFTYNLIMRDKEKLLSLDNPLKFIFSHSALREGWDNPNVFQICTISHSTSAIKKRQEIGRGMRLPVDQDGERIQDEYVNNLVIVANESYDEFAASLQREFEDDCGIVFGKLPLDAFVGIKFTRDEMEIVIDKKLSEKIWNKIKAQALIDDDGFIKKEFNDALENMTFEVDDEFKTIKLEIVQTVEKYQIEKHIEDRSKKFKGKLNEKILLDPEFEKFWNSINARTIYSVNYSTQDLVKKASAAIMEMEKIEPPKIRTSLADIDVTSKGVKATQVKTPTTTFVPKYTRVPDILTYIQGKTELTRSTIYEILIKSQRLDDFQVNPQQFMDAVVKEIRSVLNYMIIEGIKYEKLEGITYEMSRLRDDAHKLDFSKERIVPTNKSVYDYILYDSGVEKQFAEGLEALKDVKYFIKLPSWFLVPTPIGNYNPDWAILRKNGDIVYMIRETKTTKEQLKLRGFESAKIRCGARHFETIGVDYDVATSISDANL
ncbi:MAG: restriction endonuclease [Planctomycetota bacterium]|jgi:type III restriction enzyme